VTTVTREEIEQQIATISRDIDILNCKIAEAQELIEKRARLRNKLQNLITQLNIIIDAETECKPLFVFRGKNKDLLQVLQEELEKVQ
jgi:hypothetical protein